jgi:aspartate-semialdehyde dehydrogenase
MKLLSFQKIPEAVFGGQLAFNVLPRLRRERRAAHYHDELTELESRIRSELQSYLASRVDTPALRLVQVPVFYSLAVSLYVETSRVLNPESAARELAGERVLIKKLSEPPPSQVQVTGSNDIFVDAIWVDHSHGNGLWIWATADNIRLAAVNAVEIAERPGRSQA